MNPQLIHLTPPGRGAVASLRIEGPGALEAAADLFVARGSRRLSEIPLGQIAVGRVGDEEVVACRVADGAVELHCHGGLAAVARLEDLLVARGCRKVSWQEWAAGQVSDPIAAQAWIALAEARTARTAAILLDQHHGALRKAFESIETSIAAGDASSARREIDSLLALAPVGLHLVRPWQVVVAGRPNVGKSSLINAIAGYQRAIVHSEPGTTRDVLSVRTALDGWPVEISDTAGLRAAEDDIERAGIALAQEKIAAADLVLLVFDVSAPWSAEDEEIRALVAPASAGEAIGATMEPRTLCVANKNDLPPSPDAHPPAMSLSAATGSGVDALCRALAGRLVAHPPPLGAAVPFLPEHVERLRIGKSITVLISLLGREKK